MGGDRIVNSDHGIGIVTGNGARTEQALRASELSYRRLFEAAQDGILILDVDTGRINDVNPFLFKLLGFSRDEMIGRTVGELSPFKDIVSNQTMLERLQEDGYVHYTTCHWKRGMAARLPWNLSATFIKLATKK
jgi:PAS domain S-box-containing protein